MRKLILFGSILVLLLSVSSLFFPFQAIKEYHTIRMNDHSSYTYYIESYLTGSDLTLAVWNVFLLLLSVVFVLFPGRNPFYGIFSAIINLGFVGYLMYTTVYTEIQNYDIQAGIGLYMAIIATNGVLGLAVLNGFKAEFIMYRKELLDSI